MLNLFRKILQVKNSKFFWGIPVKSTVLIYDRSGSEYILQYINHNYVKILDIRRESINIPVLILSWFNWKKYIIKYIEFVNPSLVITFIDNREEFYLLKRKFPKVKFVFVQNGIRAVVGDIFGRLTEGFRGQVDYMFVHNDHIGAEYSKYISGKYISIGSLKNNSVIKSKQAVSKKDIVFISQYHTRPEDGQPLWVEPNGEPYFWEEFFQAEIEVLSFLKNYVKKNNLKLSILGRLKEDSENEIEYYSKLLNTCNWEYLAQKSSYSAYHYLDLAKTVVFIDSTLGFESIARGNKTAALSIRRIKNQELTYPFAWPAKLSESGPFWTSINSIAELQRVVDYVISVNMYEWNKTIQKFRGKIMDYDLGNQKFISIMNALEIPLIDDYIKLN